jgi:quinol monooxygenase YgiN
MSVIVVVEFVPAEGKADALRDALVASIPAVHEEEGCEHYSIQSASDGRIIMIEKWTAVELLDEHGAGPAVAALDARIAGLTSSKPIVQRLTAIPAGTTEQGSL